MDKYDVRKLFKELYAPRARDFEVVTVPPLNYLMLDGQGNPGTALKYRTASRSPPQRRFPGWISSGLRPSTLKTILREPVRRI